jgi:hypothetical protein
MEKIKFEGNPPYALPMVQDVIARAEGAAVEVTLDLIAPPPVPCRRNCGRRLTTADVRPPNR